jgi:hypothetical protein
MRPYFNGVMFSHLGPVPFFDVCVQVADFFIRVENVSWALGTGVVGDTPGVVFTCSAPRSRENQPFKLKTALEYH